MSHTNLVPLLAAPHTLLGRLQRGRGDAVRELLQMPREAAAPTVLQCLCTLGIDSQHAVAYLELVLACVPDLSPWYRWFDGLSPDLPEDGALCAFHVLGGLARLDHADTREFLGTYVVRGPRWADALSQYLDGLELDQAVWLQLLPRLDDETLASHVWHGLDRPVWTRLAAADARVRRVLDDVRQRRRRQEAELAWSEANYANAALSQRRWRVLASLLQRDPVAARPLLVDGLWDGSWCYRMRCIERCDPSWPGVRDRLTELARGSDEGGVAEAARRRLAAGPPE